MTLAERTLCLVIAMACGGCPRAGTSPGGADPARVVSEYAEAVRAEQYDRAYELMSATFRKRYSKKEFVRLLQENRGEVRFNAARLAGKPRAVRVEAKLAYGDSDDLRLVKEKGVWKIASDPGDFYGQDTPAHALRSFVRAIENKRYDIILRFVPATWAESMTEAKLRQQWEGSKRGEVGQLVKNLKANLRAPIHQSGDRATMPYGDNQEVRFVREEGIWKIEDPD